VGQIIKSLASVCHSVSLSQSVCKHSYGRNFQIKSNQIIYLDKQIQKTLTK